ncbi:putative vesicle-associated membrane protein 726 [Vespula maculifrons]|uniref:Vesicle-associated membrane protein 726 n=1 Tax=Vespula maculifrons TaxID=7453 RepID=A0ABD2CB86_VESMC
MRNVFIEFIEIFSSSFGTRVIKRRTRKYRHKIFLPQIIRFRCINTLVSSSNIIVFSFGEIIIKMSVIVHYAVVAFWEKSGCKIVADYLVDPEADCREIALTTIQDIKNLENDRTSLDRGKYMVHLLIGELHYACLTIKPESSSAISQLESCSQIFLDRLRNIYRELPILADLSRDLTNLAVADLSKPLQQIIDEYNQQESNAIPKLEIQLVEIRHMLMDGIQKLIDRGQKLDDLLRKTQTLQITSRKDFHVATKIPRKKNVFLAATAATLMFLSTSLFVFLLYIDIL